MKKLLKSSIVIAAGALAFVLAACNQGSSTSSQSTPPSSSSVVDVKVTTINVRADKNNLRVGETAQLTVEVLPANATNKAYTLSVDNSGVVSVDANGKVTALKAGTGKVTATAKDGSGVKGETTFTVTDLPNPTITLTSKDPITVNAGESATLPTATATDYDGTDITALIEIEDPFDPYSIEAGMFSSKIAGVHTIDYYVETVDGRSATASLTVTVVPATAENFDVTGYQDPSSVATYGVFKENFATAGQSKLGISDPNGAVEYSGTSDAIAGNSMIIDANKTAGSASNQVFLNGFNEYFLKGTYVSYKLEFDYKVLEYTGTNMNDFYCSLMWDGSDGLNVSGMGSGTGHITAEWKQVKIPESGNAWFSFWKLSVSGDDAVIAIDNVVVTTTPAKQVDVVVPTAAQIADGFEFDMENAATTASNGEILDVNDIENQTAKAAIQANPDFSTGVLHLTHTDDHKLDCFTADNLVPGTTFHYEMTYYAVNADRLFIILMGNGNPTLTSDVKDLGNGFYRLTCEADIQTGHFQINVYGQGNNAFDIYIGNIYAKSYSTETAVTTAQLAETDGYTWDLVASGTRMGYKRAEALADLLDEDSVAKLAVKGYENGIEIAAADASENIVFSGLNKNNMVSGYQYDVEFKYYVPTEGGINISHILIDGNGASVTSDSEDVKNDSQEVIGKIYTVSFTQLGAAKKIAFWNQNGGLNAVLLSAHAKATVTETPAITACYNSGFTKDGGSVSGTVWTEADKEISIPAAGLDSDATLWFSTNQTKLTSGVKFIAKFTINYKDGFEGGKIQLRQGSELFELVDANPSAGTYTYEVPFTSTGDSFIGLYFLHCKGDATVSSISFLEAPDSIHYKDLTKDGLDSYNADTREAYISDSAKDSTLWFTTSAGSFLVNGKSYLVSFTVEYGDDFESQVVSLRRGMQFQNIDYNPSGTKTYQMVWADNNSDGFFGLYISNGKGSYRITPVCVRLIEEGDTTYGFHSLQINDSANGNWNGTTHNLHLALTTTPPDHDATLWVTTGSDLEAGKTYVARFTIEYADGYAATKLCLREGSSFYDIDKGMVGGTKDYVVAFTSNGDSFFGLYFIEAVGDCKVSAVSVEAVEYGVRYMSMQCDGGDTEEHETTNAKREIKLNLPDGNNSVWFRTSTPSLEADAVYEVRFDLEVRDDTSYAEKLLVRCDSCEIVADSNVGEGMHYYSVFMTGSQLMTNNCFGLKFVNAVGNFYVTSMDVFSIDN